MTARPLTITAILVVHNEERFVAQCLDSLAAVADEILVAHDGPCSDRSLEIARTYTPHVWVHERRGAPESHLIRLLHRASHDWILRLDCDEAFSPALREHLLAIKTGGGHPDVTHYTAIWRAIYSPADESPARPHEHASRTVLFRRSHTSWIGIPHAAARVSGTAQGIRECVYHYAPHQQYTLGRLLTQKLYPFSIADAAIRVRHPIEVIGHAGRSVDDVLGPADRLRSTWPLLAAVPLAIRAGIGEARRAIRAGSPIELARNLRWPIAHAAYQLMLGWQIYRLRRRGFTPRLAPQST